MKHEVKTGMTDYSVLVFIPDSASTDGSGKTGLVAANLTVSGVRVETDNDVTVIDYTASLNNLALLTTAHTDWGLLEVSSTLAPGLYRLDIADAIFAIGAWSAVVYVMVTTSAAAASPMEFVMVPDAPVTGVNVSQWLGTAVSTPTVAGVPNVNAKTWNDLATVALPLTSTVAGRPLDVTATGAAGIDWANVENPTTTLVLSGTTVGVVALVTTATTLTNLPAITANWLTAAGTAADFGMEVGTAVWASTTRTVTSLAGLTVDTVTTLTNLPAITANWLTSTGIANNAITAAKIADAAIDTATFAASATIPGCTTVGTTANAGAVAPQSAAVLAMCLPPTTVSMNSTGQTVDFNASTTFLGFAIQSIGDVPGEGTLDGRIDESPNGLDPWVTIATFPTVSAFGDLHRVSFTRTQRYLRWSATVAGPSPEFTLSVCVGDTPYPDVNVLQISGDSTAANNAEAFFDGTGYAGTNNIIPTVTVLTNLPAITTNWLTAAGTAADFTTEIQAGLATGANLATVAGYLDTEIAAIKTKTDQLTFTIANQVDSNALSGGGGGGLDAAGVRAAVGLASANLDTQLTAIDDLLDTEVAAIYSRIGAPVGLSISADIVAIKTQTAAIEVDTGTDIPATITTLSAYVDTEVAAIKAKTDNLPSDPADQSAVEAVIISATSGLATAAALTTVAGYIDTEVAAIKAKTDNLPASPAAVGSAMTLEAGAITEATITTPVEAAGRPTTILGMVRRIFERATGGNKKTRNRTTGAVTLRNAMDSGNLETATQSTAGTTDSITQGG